MSQNMLLDDDAQKSQYDMLVSWSMSTWWRPESKIKKHILIILMIVYFMRSNKICAKNRIDGLISKAKSSFLSNLVAESSANPRTLWKTLYTILNRIPQTHFLSPQMHLPLPTHRGVIWGGRPPPPRKKKKERKKGTMNNVKLLHIKCCFFQFLNSPVALKN